jgi:hypothetical protein
MSDETNVEAGSETSGETAAVDTAQADTASTDTAATDTAQADAGASADAGGAATETTATDVPVDASRTGFVESGQPGGECTCPDGRKGTIHRFDAGLVCIPNADQG